MWMRTNNLNELSEWKAIIDDEWIDFEGVVLKLKVNIYLFNELS